MNLQQRQLLPLSKILLIVVGGILIFLLIIAKKNFGDDIHLENENIAIPFELFPEPPWRTPSTLDARTVTSTPFARFEIHKVKTESGDIVNDWLWTDERSHVNILVTITHTIVASQYDYCILQVHLKDEDKYLMFYQKKYGLENAAYATIGGLFNIGETADECARRELLEETGLETDELISLGKYRVQVNRGGGFLYAYLAKNSVLSNNRKKSDDYENQEIRKLTKKELLDVILAGQVGEAQWVATAALGILFDDYAAR
jgi:ADP-ribose pyrophosphatase YjhB (NUDIX family)